MPGTRPGLCCEDCGGLLSLPGLFGCLNGNGEVKAVPEVVGEAAGETDRCDQNSCPPFGCTHGRLWHGSSGSTNPR